MRRTFARAPGIQAAFGARTIYKEGKFGPFGRRSKCIPCDSIMASDRSRSRLAALSVYWVTAVYQFSDRGQTELTTSSRPPKPTVLIPTTDLENQYTVRNWYTAQTVGGSALSTAVRTPTKQEAERTGTGPPKKGLVLLVFDSGYLVPSPGRASSHLPTYPPTQANHRQPPTTTDKLQPQISSRRLVKPVL
jgi:hypothetical protein